MVIYKFFTLGEYEKKENWINYMCSKGYALKNFNICKFDFEPCEPNKYYYALEFLENLPSSPSNDDFLNYLRDEWDIEYVCQYRSWVFFRRSKLEGKFSLFNDISKKVYYLKRILIFRFVFVFILIASAILNFVYSSGYSDYIFAFLLFIISTILILVTIPSFIKYEELKKLDES